ncbi:MAG TPA: hypothetical protein GXX45_19835 [Pseudomonas aeruginosa]|uniref:type II toxin-antitoxin system YafO family toxin n=1 Tax=Pseudomonas aeruginosa TaxID=287 RepID=UPI0009A450BF|nr:type II toxin-antitoxin system YafO family toxin [Pseudomonas aeruginosa]ELK4763612.1 type II toxin-antitoxin system YafO family toxin [Pseudomonas aeruginosa]ELP1283442.1 type II toxin-antitoxin system YafO family toxin [Pseudomonas aeruginosa]MBH4376232.1 type II toxin-antitoxin system YafO family toxin [Pseudomonas aeruginosa]MBI7282008.1 type II toxin-antitoxin system YafO family toxin [Pseudomonas aeruginosa]
MIEISPFFDNAFDLSDHTEQSFRDALVLLFQSYIQSHGHKLAGRDAPYHRPPNTVVTDVCLRHVHLSPLQPDKGARLQWKRNRTSDRCLVYARSTCKHHLLIAYMNDGAHSQAQDYDYLKALATIAEKWLHKNNLFADTDPVF